jgi:hypothetical protein
MKRFRAHALWEEEILRRLTFLNETADSSKRLSMEISGFGRADVFVIGRGYSGSAVRGAAERIAAALNRKEVI